MNKHISRNPFSSVICGTEQGCKSLLGLGLVRVRVMALIHGLKGVLEGLAPTKIIGYISVLIKKIFEAISNSSIQAHTGGKEVKL